MPRARKQKSPRTLPPPRVGEESRRIMHRAKQEADDILAKAKAILAEAKSVQTTFDNDLKDDRARARRIGYDEGFRAGQAHGSESGRHPRRGRARRSRAVEILTEAAGRLRETLERFEEDRKRYLEGLRQIVRRVSVGVDGERNELPKALEEFLQDEPPRANLRPEDEIWLEKVPGNGEEREPSLAVSSESGRERGRRRGSDVSR